MEENFYRIVIIEDNQELRALYEEMIRSDDGLEVVGSYSSCEESLKRFPKDNPDLVIIDLTLHGMSGIEGIGKLRKISPKLKILVLTVHDDNEHVFEALCAGAIGYLTKDANHNELIHAILQTLAGGAPISPKIANLIITSFHRNQNSPLTDRETQVLQQLAKGKTYDYIAVDLSISRDTVKTHVKHIYEKLQVGNKSEALIKARKDHLVQ